MFEGILSIQDAQARPINVGLLVSQRECRVECIQEVRKLSINLTYDGATKTADTAYVKQDRSSVRTKVPGDGDRFRQFRKSMILRAETTLSF